MEDQIISAILIAWDSSADQNLKRQAFEFVNRIRTEPTSCWQPCLDIFAKLPREAEVVRLFSLEIVNAAVQGGTLGNEEINHVQKRLLTYLQQSYLTAEGAAQNDGNVIENKLAQNLTYLFTVLYDTTWSSFFDDLLRLTGRDGNAARDNPPGVIFYLRVVNSIHDEIGDQLLARTPDEEKRASALKDVFRERDMQKLANTFEQLLSIYGTHNEKITELCFKAVSKYVSWIDTSLVVNPTMLDLLFQQLDRAQTIRFGDDEEQARDAAVDVLIEIVSKKMAPNDKVEIFRVLKLPELITQISSFPPLQDPKSSQYDTDFAERVARLMSSAVADTVRILNSQPESSDVWQRSENVMQALIPHMLRFFSDEYDEVCSTAISAVTEVLGYLGKATKRSGASPQHTVTLLQILKAIFAKLRYDETASWGEEDDETDEAEFQELRRRLGVLQQTVAQADERLFADAVIGLVVDIFTKVQNSSAEVDWRDVELAMYQIFSFGELAVKTGGLYVKNKPNSPAAESLVQMMTGMVNTDLSKIRHPACHLQYMEICVRYSSFFVHHSEFVLPVLQNFLQIAHHDILKVKIRSWYLLHRYVLATRMQMGDVAEAVVQRLNDLLTIKAETPTVNDGDDSSDVSDSSDTLFQSQLYLFETIGVVCGSNAVPVEKQVACVEIVEAPLFSSLERNLPAARSGNDTAILQVNHDLMALGTLARGFSDWTPGAATATSHAPAPAIQASFGRVSDATLIALESCNSSAQIRSASRFALTRLLGVLGVAVLSSLTRWIDGLLIQEATKEEISLFMRFLGQLVYGFKSEVSQVLDAIFTNVVQRVFTSMSTPPSGTDEEIELSDLKKEYLNFLLVVLSNNLGSVIVSQSNQPVFETVIETIEHFAKDTNDYPVGKMAFGVLTRMCAVWGGPDTVNAGKMNGASTTGDSVLPGFDDFMMTRFSPLAWALAANVTLNVKDGQARQVLQEAGALQKTIYLKTGPQYLSHLADNELRPMGMDETTMAGYLERLRTDEIRHFKVFFAQFISQIRGA